MSKTSSSTPPADVEHFPVLPPYVVALSVVAAVVVSALVIFILYYCLFMRSGKVWWTTVKQSPTRETEQLREEPAVELDVSLTDTAGVVAGQIKRKQSPSIFSRGDFQMEVLERVENTTDLSIEEDAKKTSHISATVTMDDQEKDNNYSVAPFLSTPTKQSVSMDPVEYLSCTPTVTPSCSTLGLRVREGCQADASTVAIRGSISSGEGCGSSAGDEVIVCEDIDIYKDPEECKVKDVDIGIECHEEVVLNLAKCFHEHAALTTPEVDQVKDLVISPASDSAIKKEESFSVDIGDIEFVKDNIEDEGYEYSSLSPKMLDYTSSPKISDQDESCNDTPPQETTCLAELDLTPAPTIPFNIIPVSSQKHPIPSTLSHSTPTSLLHPLVSMHALPLAERALSVSHLSLNRSGKHLPTTPLSCNSDYSPVYNIQFGSARGLLATDEIVPGVAGLDSGEGEEKKF